MSDEVYNEMTTNLIGFRKTLHDASFGEIPVPVGATIEALLNTDFAIELNYKN